jgi:hypothetical protein
VANVDLLKRRSSVDPAVCGGRLRTRGHRIRVSLVLVVLAAAAGCPTASTRDRAVAQYGSRAPTAPISAPGKTLVAGFVVHVDQDPFSNLVIRSEPQNLNLDTFGWRAAERVGEILAARGYEVYFDGARTERLRDDAGFLGLAKSFGRWRHPQAASWQWQKDDGSKVVHELKTEQREFFAFVDVQITDRGVAQRTPHVTVHATILDELGRHVLELRGAGKGPSSLGVASFTAASLDQGLGAALASIRPAATTRLP